MQISDFLNALPSLDMPFDDSVLTTRALRSERGLTVFFFPHQDLEIPEHSHKGQFGTVLAGQLDLTMNGETVSYTPGMSYDIPSGTPHAAKSHAGSVILDIFEEPDRYPLKG